MRLWLAAAGVALVLVGCAVVKARRMPPLPPSGYGKVQQAKVPALLSPKVSGEGKVSRMAVDLPPRQGRITLAWDNEPSACSNLFWTGLEASTNLAQWQEVVRLPYTTRCAATLTNRPPWEFYRAFNRLR